MKVLLLYGTAGRDELDSLLKNVSGNRNILLRTCEPLELEKKQVALSAL